MLPGQYFLLSTQDSWLESPKAQPGFWAGKSPMIFYQRRFTHSGLKQ